MTKWTAAEIPDLGGRIAVVTGASSGIGEAAADALLAKGAEVVLAVRNAEKGERVLAAMLRRHPGAKARVMIVDLADLASVREFADKAVRALPQIDILLNNAGLGMQRARAVTVDGFERQFGTNHLGQFALTGLLLPALLKAPSPRVVSISSLAHRGGAIDFEDLQGAKRYGGGKAYNQSKLANVLFALELDRRAQAAGARLVSLAAHPGVAATGFVAAIGLPGLVSTIAEAGMKVIGQSATQGALPGLYAATMPDVKGGDYFGPDGIGELRGYVKRAVLSAKARDPALAASLWSVSEELTGVTFRQLESRFRNA